MSRNVIHPTAIIGENVVLGKNNSIGPYSIIQGNTIIGDGNIISSHVVIGCEPTDSKHNQPKAPPRLIIGDDNIIREFCVVEMPVYENETVIGNKAFLMQGVHVSHDCIIEDSVVITNLSVLGGIAKFLTGANIGMGVTVNQYTIIGQYSIAATNSAVMKNIKPFSRYIPNKPISVNEYAIKKFGFQAFSEEINGYVLDNKRVSSPLLVEIVNKFEFWVNKYGHGTYS